MAELKCPGLPASWLNGWLAAVGTTVLVPSLRLSWIDGPSPYAVLITEGDVDPVDAVAAAWPTAERVADMPIAKNWRNGFALKRQPPLQVFSSRAAEGRSHPDIWTLSSTLTDLFVDLSDVERAKVRHSRLDPAAPGTTGTLHDRLLKVLSYVDNPREAIVATFAGRARRAPTNGLGFDVTRITALGDASDPRIDPVVEALAFFGLGLFPMCGDGTCADWRGASDRRSLRQRSWHLIESDNPRPRRMAWPAWSPPLGRFGIDALLDVWNFREQRSWKRFGVHAAWASAEYVRRAAADSTRGIGSEAL